MECLIGVAFKDFVIIAADKMNVHSIVAINDEENKLYKLSDHLGMLVSGEAGDTIQFAEFISKNIQLYKMRNGFELSPGAAANFTRKNLADYLRSRTPYNVNLLMAGFDKEEGGCLYYLDYLATMAKLPYAVHGYGGFFVLGLLDRFYNKNLNQEEAIELVRKCINEIHKRFIVSLSTFKVWVVTKDGITDLEDISAKDKA